MDCGLKPVQVPSHHIEAPTKRPKFKVPTTAVGSKCMFSDPNHVQQPGHFDWRKAKTFATSPQVRRVDQNWYPLIVAVSFSAVPQLSLHCG